MPVNTKRPEYNKFSSLWEKTRDCITGQDEVKSKGTKYLRKLSGQESDRYEGYLNRATFIDFSKRALNVAVGQLFRKPPIVQGIDEDILTNVDLKGTSFDYFWRQIASEVITTNRVGIHLDYQENQARPMLIEYKAETIINWQTDVIDGIEKLTLVVLEGVKFVDNPKDSFVQEEVKAWKVLELVDGVYEVSEWEERIMENGRTEYVEVSRTQPVFNNNSMSFIPFFMITNNGISIELTTGPLLSMVNLNLGHYRNYADLENMLFFTGVKTLVTTEWPKNDIFPLGGHANFSGEKGKAEYLEASSDSGLKDELQSKVEKMATISSSFLAGSGRYVASAETARLTTEGEFATLGDISSSLTISANQIMALFVEWQKGSAEEIKIAFNKDFETSEINPQLLTSLMGALGSGYISEETFYFNLRNKEMYPPGWTLDQEQDAIKSGVEKQIQRRDEVIGDI